MNPDNPSKHLSSAAEETAILNLSLPVRAFIMIALELGLHGLAHQLYEEKGTPREEQPKLQEEELQEGNRGELTEEY